MRECHKEASREGDSRDALQPASVRKAPTEIQETFSRTQGLGKQERSQTSQELLCRHNRARETDPIRQGAAVIGRMCQWPKKDPHKPLRSEGDKKKKGKGCRNREDNGKEQ